MKRSIYFFFCLCFLSQVAVGYAQTTDSQTQDTRKKLFLSLDEAINMALQNNLDISIAQYDPEIKREDINNAESAFDSGFSTGTTQTFTESPSTTTAQSSTDVTAGIGKRFKTGGSYQLGVSTNRSSYDDSSLDDSYTTGLNLTLTQPLLKNLGTEVNTVAIVSAKKSREISVSSLRNTIITAVSDVKNTYWKLIFAIGDLEAKRLSLQLAYDLVKINEAQVNVGTLAPIEILQAKATAAAREVEIISAEQDVRDVEDDLKRLLNIPESDPVWSAAIIPTDTPLSSAQAVSLEQSIQQALENREDLFQLKKNIEIQELLLRTRENALKPELDLKGGIGVNGADDNFGGTFSNLTDFDLYSVNVGVEFSYPLGNNAAESQYNQKKLEVEQTKLSLQNLEQGIITQIRQAVRAVETSYQLVEATKIAMQLAQEQLDAEQKKFNEGLSTNFQVLDYQEKLASARSSHTEAITGYNQALVGLEQLTGVTLQRHNIIIKE